MNLLRLFTVHPTHAPLSEKIRSGVAGGLTIFLLAAALYYVPLPNYPLVLLGSIAASAVLLFAIPHSPLAQPWNLVGGHFVSAIAGWVCILLIHDPLIAAGLSVGLAIFLMHYLNCLHPPGAATALAIIVNGAHFQEMGWKWMVLVVMVNTLIPLLLALGFNRLIPGRHYPMQTPASLPVKATSSISIEQADLEWALAQMKEVIDVSAEDLAAIYALAQSHAQGRSKRS